MTIEGDCADCGVHFVTFSNLDAKDHAVPRCMSCLFIREAAPEDQAGLRAMLWSTDHEREWKYWRERGAYHDETCAERACDRCGKLYRGPAVYCRLTCALADA
jgi:hypothetical protein